MFTVKMVQELARRHNIYAVKRNGEWRISYFYNHLAKIEGLKDIKTIKRRAEETAYYTDDNEDAYHTILVGYANKRRNVP